ncbi:hypothetical protein ACFQI7_09845 [Paenibacillus allorhizosphaerae]|uniref:hypothetical protein n=1 Tax=Paenibacillus allorhizosphaerae TaxID=2849866 RepID=UPI001C4063C3|nr:hypothetical protein [Paenibacillus allorhizosphaerae]
MKMSSEPGETGKVLFAAAFTSTRFHYRPVWDAAQAAMSPGVPQATTEPLPRRPPGLSDLISRHHDVENRIACKRR